jgi:hypothetical protein
VSAYHAAAGIEIGRRDIVQFKPVQTVDELLRTPHMPLRIMPRHPVFAEASGIFSPKVCSFYAIFLFTSSLSMQSAYNIQKGVLSK